MDVFAALADPTRRRIVEMLGGGPIDAGSIAASFAVSQPAVSRHLRVLRDCGLVEARAEGTRRIYRLREEGLAELERWLERYRGFWADRLEGLARSIEEGR